MTLITESAFPLNAYVPKADLRTQIRAIADRINVMPDKGDPGGDQTIGKVGRPIVVLAGQGSGPIQAAANMDFGGIAGICGDLLVGLEASTSRDLTTTLHAGRIVFCTNSADIVLTLRKGTDQALHATDRFTCLVYRMGDGAITIVGADGLTLRNASGHTRLSSKYSSARLIRWADDLLFEGGTAA